MKFRAIFENFEKEQKKTDVFNLVGPLKVENFGAAEGGNFGAAEGGNFGAAECGNFGAAECGKISNFYLKFREFFENFEKEQKKQTFSIWWGR